ncbi:putative ABC transport system permease protein [Luteibacter sp. HA06]
MRRSLSVLARTWRNLWLPRGFLPLASITLAIGLAAFAAALTVAECLLGSPPFPHDASLVMYGEQDRDPVSRAASPMAYDILGLPPGVISRGAAQFPESVNVRSGNNESLVRAQRVDEGFLPTMGIGSVLPDDPSIAFAHSVMLSNTFWRRSMGGDPQVVGRFVTVDGEAMRVRGVLPPEYRLFADTDMLLPRRSTGPSRNSAANIVAFARLAPGVSAESLAPWMQEKLSASALPARADCHCAPVYEAVPIARVLTYKARPVVLLFMAGALLVLAVAGVNLSNIMLSRALRRTHETCLMTAFGGKGWRPMLPMIADVVAIGTCALILALPIAHALVMVVRNYIPAAWLISASPIDLDWRVNLTTGGASLVVATASATLGLVHASPTRLLRTLFASGGTSPAGLGRRTRRYLVLVQTAIATLLLALGVATACRLWRATQIPLGFHATGASFVEINPDPDQFPTPNDVHRATEAIRSAAMRQPGIDAAAVVTTLPVGPGFFMPFRRPDGGTSYLRYALVSPGTVGAMGLSLIAGHDIRTTDSAATQGVAVVNQAYLDRIDRRGLGALVIPASRLATNRPLRIVGVVADTHAAGAERPAEPTVFVALSQVDASTYTFMRRLVATYLVVRGSGSLVSAHVAIQAMIGEAAPGLAAGSLHPLRDVALDATAEARRNAVLSAIFSVMALSLACVGLYAAQALEMSSRRRDTTLREALGGTPLDLLGHNLSRGISMATPGIALGLLAAGALGEELERSALRLGRIDTAVATAVALVMTVSAIGALAVPTLRAVAVRPVNILGGDRATSSRRHSRNTMPRSW